MKVLDTGRLTIRHLEHNDATFILRLLNEPSFIEFIGDKGVRNGADACRYLDQGPMASYQEHGFGLYRVSLKFGGDVVGICGILKREELPHPDLGFAFLPKYWSQGYAFESAQALMEYEVNKHQLDEVLAITTPHNESSGRLLERLGFVDEGNTQLKPDSDEVKLFRVKAEGIAAAR
ncbi:MAG: GNAT family N-acetyltransferase [Xanthomonadales bacterium]|nr:GNAT family N-acetyltransferase [Xanthomonadales bacterium]